MKVRQIIYGAILSAAILFTVFFGAGKISEKKSYIEEKPYKGVITVWQIDTFEGGAGSRKNFLLSAARGYEKKENGVLVMVIAHTEESAKAALINGEAPDAVSYGTGFAASNVKKLTLKNSFAGGCIGEEAYAVPWCRGGYVLIENPAIKSKSFSGGKENGTNNKEFTDLNKELPDLSEETVLVSEGRRTAPTVAAALSGLKIKEAEGLAAAEAYTKFTEGKTRYLLGTQRDIVRLTRRGFAFKSYPLFGYNDLYQYISLTSVSPEKSIYAERFIEYLITENVQKNLGKICMFSNYFQAEEESDALSQMQKKNASRTLLFFTDERTYEEIRSLSYSAAEGNEKDLNKLKNFLV